MQLLIQVLAEYTQTKLKLIILEIEQVADAYNLFKEFSCFKGTVTQNFFSLKMVSLVV